MPSSSNRSACSVAWLRRAARTATIGVTLAIASTTFGQSIPDVTPEPRAGSNTVRAESGEGKLIWRTRGAAAQPTLAPELCDTPTDAPAGLKLIEVPTEPRSIDDDARPVVRTISSSSSSRTPRRTRLDDPTAEPLPVPSIGPDTAPPQALRGSSGAKRIPAPPHADDPWSVAPPPRNPVDPPPVAAPQRLPSHAAPIAAQYAEPEAPDQLWGLPREFEAESYSRFDGRGDPLIAGSWLNRPMYVGGFFGPLSGDTLIAGRINQNAGLLGGFRFGWDYDHYWGVEARVGFATQGLEFLNDPTLDGKSNDLILGDFNLVYYPWGDSRWRPFVSIGLGVADYDFVDELGIRRSDMVFAVPLSVGLKYRMNQYWTWRFDVTDNIIFGGEASFATQNEFSLLTGMEYRFGGSRRSYWPWNPSNRYR